MFKDRFIPTGEVKSIGRKINKNLTGGEKSIYHSSFNIIMPKKDKPKHAIKLPSSDSVRDLI